MGRGSRTSALASARTIRDQLRARRGASVAAWRPDYVADAVAQGAHAALTSLAETSLTFSDPDMLDTVDRAWRRLLALLESDLRGRAADAEDPAQAGSLRGLDRAADELSEAMRTAFNAGMHGTEDYAKLTSSSPARSSRCAGSYPPAPSRARGSGRGVLGVLVRGAVGVQHERGGAMRAHPAGVAEQLVDAVKLLRACRVGAVQRDP